MSESKTSDAQKRATQAYRERNREKTRKQSARSAAKTFINKYAELDDESLSSHYCKVTSAG